MEWLPLLLSFQLLLLHPQLEPWFSVRFEQPVLFLPFLSGPRYQAGEPALLAWFLPDSGCSGLKGSVPLM
jgi:hypothetical protein